MDRKQIIKTIIELHNFFIIEWSKSRGTEISKDSLWDIQLLEVKPDRYYLVESLSVANDDYENKKFKPKTQVRYLLRSKEAYAYGEKHQAFYNRYLSTIEIGNEYLTDPQGYKDSLIKDMAELHKEKK